MVNELERRTRAYFEDDPAPSHLDFAEAHVAAGGSIQGLAEDLGQALGFNIDRETLRRYLYSLDPEHANERLTRAREEGAHAKAEQTQSIADDAKPEEAATARLRVSARQWTAEKWNPQAFGQKQGSSVTVNLGALHLAAISRDSRDLKNANVAEKVTGGTMKALPGGSDAVEMPTQPNATQRVSDP